MSGKKKKNIEGPVVLVIDVGGSNTKLRKSDSPHTLKFKSGPEMTPGKMVGAALALPRNGVVVHWSWDNCAIRPMKLAKMFSAKKI